VKSFRILVIEDNQDLLDREVLGALRLASIGSKQSREFFASARAAKA
jgi:hypothetical protein